MVCPCGSGRALDDCCGRFHRGEPPPTAEALMRARYSAYALGHIDFIADTGPDPDRAGIEAFARRARFVGLKVEATEAGAPDDDAGTVTFAARFIEGGKLHELRERSRFGKQAGRWRYLGGDARVGRIDLSRNDPCPCGSGEKAKRCHLR